MSYCTRVDVILYTGRRDIVHEWTRSGTRVDVIWYTSGRDLVYEST